MQSQACSSRSVLVWGTHSIPGFMERAQPAWHLQPSRRDSAHQRCPLFGVNEPGSRGHLCFESTKRAGLERWEPPQAQAEPLCSLEKPRIAPLLHGLSSPVPKVGAVVLPTTALLPRPLQPWPNGWASKDLASELSPLPSCVSQPLKASPFPPVRWKSSRFKLIGKLVGLSTGPLTGLLPGKPWAVSVNIKMNGDTKQVSLLGAEPPWACWASHGLTCTLSVCLPLGELRHLPLGYGHRLEGRSQLGLPR